LKHPNANQPTNPKKQPPQHQQLGAVAYGGNHNHNPNHHNLPPPSLVSSEAPTNASKSNARSSALTESGMIPALAVQARNAEEHDVTQDYPDPRQDMMAHREEQRNKIRHTQENNINGMDIMDRMDRAISEDQSESNAPLYAIQGN